MKPSTAFSCLATLLALSLASSGPVAAQAQKAEAVVTGEIVRFDPAAGRIIASTAKLEKLGSGFGMIEGPVWMHEGYLLFSSMSGNVIYKWEPDGKISVYLKDSGFTGQGPGPVPTPFPGFPEGLKYLIGSNGLTLDRQGRLIICEQGNSRITRLEKDGRRTVLADNFEGMKFASPNDIVVKSDGSIYFTDPAMVGQYIGHKLELPFVGVFRIKDGKVDAVAKDLKAPNGLAFTPDEKYLYINDSDTGKFFRYEVRPDGTLANPTLFFDGRKNPNAGGPDGMKVDKEGNIYAVGGGIVILSPQGTLLAKIKIQGGATNLAWGEDGKTLFITGESGLYRIRLNIPGIMP